MRHVIAIRVTFWLCIIWLLPRCVQESCLAVLPMIATALPCCCGGGGCDIFTDEFARSGSTDLGSDWTEVSGDWEIVTGYLQANTANSSVSCTVAGCTAKIILKTKVLGDYVSPQPDGPVARLCIGYVDDDNYVFGGITIQSGSPRLEVGTRSGGTDTIHDTSTTGGSGFGGIFDDLRLCWDESLEYLSIEDDVSGAIAETTAVTSIANDVVGLAVRTLGVFPSPDYTRFFYFTAEGIGCNNSTCESC